MRPKKLNFPPAPGIYWYLYWIGKIHFDKIWKVELYFINKNNRDDQQKDYNSSFVECHLIDATYLCELTIGSLYNTEQCMWVTYSLPRSRTLQVKTIKKYFQTKKPFPLLGHLYFPKVSNLEDSELSYFTFHRSFGPGKKSIILVTPYVLANYFLFHSSQLVSKLLSGELLKCFDFDSLRFYYDEQAGQRAVQISYDESILKKREAQLIVPLFFIKDSVGLKMIESVYSYLHHSLISKGRSSTTSEGDYLSIDFSPAQYEMEVQGKYFYADTRAVELQEAELEYLLAYRIKSFRFLQEDPFGVDRIDLIPSNAKDSTDKRDEKNKVNVIRPKEPDTVGLTLLLNKDSSGSTTHINSTVDSNDELPFNIEVRRLKREDQLFAYQVNSVPNDQHFENLVRGVKSHLSYCESLREQIQKEVQHQEFIENYEYFRQLIKLLGEKPSLQIISDPLGIGVDNYPMELIKTGKDSKNSIDVKAINFKGRLTYLIEFGTGLIGVFNRRDDLEINRETLWSFLENVLYENERLPKRRLLWTRINRLSSSFLVKFGIQIQQGIEHQREQREVYGNVIQETAERIYKERILKRTL